MSNRKISKGDSRVVKAINCCVPGPRGFPGPPGEPGTSIIPVYGSLYNTEDLTVPVAGTNVDFNAVGPANGVTLDIVTNSITVNSSGVYTITFSTVTRAFGAIASDQSIVFELAINGTPDPTKQTVFQTELGDIPEITTPSRTDQVMLNAGDVITIFIRSASDSMRYGDSSLVVTKVA